MLLMHDEQRWFLQLMRRVLGVNLLTCVTFYVFHFKDSASQDVQVLVTVQDCSGDFELDLNLPNTFQGVIMFKCRIVRLEELCLKPACEEKLPASKNECSSILSFKMALAFEFC